VDNWRKVLRQHPAQAREIVKAIVGEVRLTGEVDVNAKNDAWLAAKRKTEKHLAAEIKTEPFLVNMLASPTGMSKLDAPARVGGRLSRAA
jgi:hypothetical protein